MSTKQPSDEALDIARRVNALPAGAQAGIAAIVSAAEGSMSPSPARMSNPSGATRVDRKALQERIEAQRRAILELQAIINLANVGLRGFSGDEDSLEIVEAISTQSFARSTVPTGCAARLMSNWS